jgi:hypothetical protein
MTAPATGDETMIAFESLNPTNWIEEPAFLAVRYGDDTPSLYAVPCDWIGRYLAAYASLDSVFECVAEQISAEEAAARFEAGAWIGIKLASAGGVAAWGRAIICPAPAKSAAPVKSAAQIKAEAPRLAKVAQEFDCSALPLFGDSARQGSLF